MLWACKWLDMQDLSYYGNKKTLRGGAMRGRYSQMWDKSANRITSCEKKLITGRNGVSSAPHGDLVFSDFGGHGAKPGTLLHPDRSNFRCDFSGSGKRLAAARGGPRKSQKKSGWNILRNAPLPRDTDKNRRSYAGFADFWPVFCRGGMMRPENVRANGRE